MPKSLPKCIEELDWQALQATLDEQGYAVLPKLLLSEECTDMMNSYSDEERFRSTIHMERYRFGRGEYKYYQAPLPELLQQLREGFYPELALTANRWLTQLGHEERYPVSLDEYLEMCHEQGQERSTPLILKYEEGGYNCLHQDLYGDEFFPLQVVFVLNKKEIDFTGGEFLLMEQRPRAQSRGHVITLEQGAGLIFPTSHRPVEGMRGYYRTTLRHGVSTITSGTRYSLGIIFHDAK
ncbi:2OG-Fe(II) oxygenase [Paenibacillus solani]|uniref:Prolyl 4-hydroxylase subunit alpha n=1 Tax=Paenibacillus solani TaxID=1705565 RepID=A0A0M1P6P5_9BACL|nr:2OG-Fe(II) oxygenase [Paenibacillus solani]KOR89714.1 prolyl 4-hydroxylase subunit alpha [Paenibacillus solani]